MERINNFKSICFIGYRQIADAQIVVIIRCECDHSHQLAGTGQTSTFSRSNFKLETDCAQIQGKAKSFSSFGGQVFHHFPLGEVSDNLSGPFGVIYLPIRLRRSIMAEALISEQSESYRVTWINLVIGLHQFLNRCWF